MKFGRNLCWQLPEQIWIPSLTSRSCYLSSVYSCKTTVRLHLRQAIQSWVMSCMMTNIKHYMWTWYCNTRLRKVKYRPFAKCFPRRELFKCLQWPSNQWTTFFCPIFVLEGFCSFAISCVPGEALHSPPGPQPACGLPACLQTAGRTTPTRFIWAWFGLARSHSDLQCRLWWLRLQPR